MNLSENTSLVSIASAFAGVLFWLGKLTWRLAQMDTKVNTMWMFQIRRAMSEVVEKGLGEMNSPIQFPEAALRFLDPIKLALMQLSLDFPTMSDGEFLLKIESVFGQQLLEIVCIPCKLSHGACLILAFCVSRGSGPLELNL